MRKTIKNRILSLFGGFAALCIALAIAFMPTAVVHADDTVSVTSLVTAGENVTLTGNVAYSTDYNLEHNNLMYPGKDIGGTNMTAISSTTSGKVTSKLIDLSTLSTSDYVMQWIPATMNVSLFTLKLIDENDPSTYVQVNFVPNYAITYDGTSYGSTTYITYTQTTGVSGSTGGIYAYGAVMGDWHGLLNGGMFNGGGGYNAGSSWEWFDSWYGTSFTAFFVGYDYETGNIITPRKNWSSEVDLPSRKPFSSSKVYAELYWESNEAGGVAIKTVAGFNTNGATVAKQTPTITAATIADAGIGDTITPTATVSECYTHTPVLSFVPYYYENSAWTDKSSLVSDGKFVPDAEGDWKVVWTADYNASAEKTFEVSGHGAAMI
ncbi:MAG: hypothetical protein IJS67_00495, partial [Clostridia bacterium]|nr:hypothetical protein [Clostridia bacterium]